MKRVWANQDLSDLERLAGLLDAQFGIPGTRFRIGLDGLFGLIPGIGDGAGALLSLYIVFKARSLGAPTGLLLRMLLNVAIDSLVGAIPVAGDLFDLVYKANKRNVRLLKKHLED
ncbi:DUF4112 domain-containing protein [Pelagibius sp. Alg239-R121]|uniref:DUF4112 domain-containing protein n=1 Tax=Pelagibius sp. Alg239-R121 TaxID=2993448 RepID=UPI0024A672FF|nr:DUF4112 domain-containing protein [Pelagibius sp. Alg239-R121]